MATTTCGSGAWPVRDCADDERPSRQSTDAMSVLAMPTQLGTPTPIRAITLNRSEISLEHFCQAIVRCWVRKYLTIATEHADFLGTSAERRDEGC